MHLVHERQAAPVKPLARAFGLDLAGTRALKKSYRKAPEGGEFGRLRNHATGEQYIFRKNLGKTPLPPVPGAQRLDTAGRERLIRSLAKR